jgi:large subunit ribosomal protein L15
LGRGELKSKISVEAHAFSETAAKAIEKVGGTATTVK